MVYEQLMQIVNYINQNLTILISYAFSIVLISIFFDDLYKILNFKENIQNLPVIRNITGFHITKRYRPLRYFDHFLSYILALVVAEAILIVVLAVGVDLLLQKYSAYKPLIIMGIIFLSYIAFVFGYHKRKFSEMP
ncbi:MAG: hypothetical protein AABW58_00700 [Nanoarchaeota archaeon]